VPGVSTAYTRAVRINLLAPIQALAAVGQRLLSAAGRRGRRGPAQSGHTNLVFPKLFKHSRLGAECVKQSGLIVLGDARAYRRRPVFLRAVAGRLSHSETGAPARSREALRPLYSGTRSQCTEYGARRGTACAPAFLQHRTPQRSAAERCRAAHRYQKIQTL